MGVDPFSLALGGLGLVSQLFGNSAQEQISNRSLDQQQQLIDRQTKLFDTIYGIAQNAQASGRFDPTSLEAQAHKDMNYSRAAAMGNEVSSARALGYRAGDSVPVAQMNQTQGDFALREADEMSGIRQNALSQELAAYGAANPGSLNAGVQADGQNSQNALAREGSMGGLLSAMAPYLASKPASAAVQSVGNTAVGGVTGGVGAGSVTGTGGLVLAPPYRFSTPAAAGGGMSLPAPSALPGSGEASSGDDSGVAPVQRKRLSLGSPGGTSYGYGA